MITGTLSSLASRTDTKDKRDTHLVVAVFFLASLILADYTIQFYVYVLGVSVHHAIIAGFTEPLTSKFIPALVTVAFLHRVATIEHLRAHPYWFGLLGGVSLGLTERVLYIVVKGASISPGFIIAPGIHALNGVLVAGYIFSTAGEKLGKEDIAKMTVLTIAAIAIHVFWNRWGVFFVYEATAGL